MRLITLHGTSLHRNGTWQTKFQTLYAIGIVMFMIHLPTAVTPEIFGQFFHWHHWHLIAGVMVGVALIAWQALIYRRIVDRIFPGTFDLEIGVVRDDRKNIPVALQLLENIAIGALEEFIYRAFLIPLCGFTVALVLFTIPHLARSIKGQVMVYGNVLICGAVLGFLFIATGSLWPGIVAHILHNVLVDQLVRKGYL